MKLSFLWIYLWFFCIWYSIKRHIPILVMIVAPHCRCEWTQKKVGFPFNKSQVLVIITGIPIVNIYTESSLKSLKVQHNHSFSGGITTPDTDLKITGGRSAPFLVQCGTTAHSNLETGEFLLNASRFMVCFCCVCSPTIKLVVYNLFETLPNKALLQQFTRSDLNRLQGVFIPSTKTRLQWPWPDHSFEVFLDYLSNNRHRYTNYFFKNGFTRKVLRKS